MIYHPLERPPEQLVVPDLAALRPHHGGLLYSAVGPEMLGSTVGKGVVLGRVVSPYTFQVLEELRAPFEENVLVLLRPGVTRVNPGDYAYMLGDLGTARTMKGGA